MGLWFYWELLGIGAHFYYGTAALNDFKQGTKSRSLQWEGGGAIQLPSSSFLLHRNKSTMSTGEVQM
jgi:hypothetical protein